MLESGYVKDNKNLKHYDKATEEEMAFKVFDQYKMNTKHFPNLKKRSHLTEIKNLYRTMYPEMGRGLGKKNDPYFIKMLEKYKEHHNQTNLSDTTN